MHRSRWLTGIAVVAVALAGCGGGGGETSAQGVARASLNSWNGYHWARTDVNTELPLELGDNVASYWDDYLHLVSTTWNQSTVLDTRVVQGGVTNLRKCPATLGRVEVCDYAYGTNGWLGLASIWVDPDKHILKGTVKLNDSYLFKSPKNPLATNANTPAWRRLVACQEIGHTFGLDHQDENFTNANLGTCMDYTNDPDGTKYPTINTDSNGQPISNEYPNADDYLTLESVYNHADATTTVGALAPLAAADLPGESEDVPEAAEWGRLVHTSPDGRLSVYENDLGGGEKRITFVTWAR